MPLPDHPLDHIEIASPCTADWNAMTGDDKSRFCKTCRKNVYNLTLMMRAEAEALIQAKEGHLCVRFAQRADGTVVTNDCPVGAAAPPPIWHSWLSARQCIAAALAAVAAVLTGSRVMAQPPLEKTSKQPAQCLQPTLGTSNNDLPPMLMGKMDINSKQPETPTPAEKVSVIRGVEKTPIIPTTLSGQPKVIQVRPRATKPLPKIIRAASGAKQPNNPR